MEKAILGWKLFITKKVINQKKNSVKKNINILN